MRLVLLAALLASSGCASHREMSAAAAPAGSDNPAVVVTSAVEVITTTGINAFGTIDIRPEPDLATAFERAIERHVDSGQFRVITATLDVHTVLNSQSVVLDMLVDAGGRTYRARHTTMTNNAGFTGSRYLREMPAYLDAAAKQIVEQLP